MKLLNEKVEHTTFGNGIITEADANRICIQFKDDVGVKLFQYPEAFEKFLKAKNSKIENKIQKDLHKKLEELELERQEKERKAAELEEKLKQLEPVKKKKATTRKTKKTS
ncbi:MAG: hypothetical protein WDA24_01170 [Tissierellales bacterium]